MSVRLDQFLWGLTGFFLVVSLACFAAGADPVWWALALDAFSAGALTIAAVWGAKPR